MTRSQSQAINQKEHKTWEDYRDGCLNTYRGGHDEDDGLSIFHHGINTVFNLLEKEFPQPHEIFKATEPFAELLRAANYLADSLDIAEAPERGHAQVMALRNVTITIGPNPGLKA